jgi:hypothetical protein
MIVLLLIIPMSIKSASHGLSYSYNAPILIAFNLTAVYTLAPMCPYYFGNDMLLVAVYW